MRRESEDWKVHVLYRSQVPANHFTGTNTFDCPFCLREQVTYRVASIQPFDMPEGAAFAYVVRCNQCYKRSVHLSRKNIERRTVQGYPETYYQFDEDVSDADFFLSVPGPHA